MPVSFGAFQVLARLETSPTTQTFVALRVGSEGIQRLVCLRTLLPELSEDEGARTAFANSAKLAAKLNHPAVVGVEAFGQERGVYYFTTEYVPGETWESVLLKAGRSRENLPAEIVVHIVAELCEGLHYAHELAGPEGSYNIVHRGIATNNIVIDDHARPRIIDFATGKSNLASSHTETGVIKGSFRYMAPEQIMGKSPDRRADIYALGEVLFESLARSSTKKLELEELATAKLDGHPRLRDFQPDIHPELDVICQLALTVEPDDRFQTAAQMHYALTSHLKTSSTKSRAALTALMEKLFGERIALRRELLRKLAFGQTDAPDLLTTLQGEAVTERDVFQGARSKFDEASFLATIRAGEMDRAEPLARAKPKLAAAKLHLRGPRAAEQPKEAEIPDSKPPIDPISELDTDEHQKDALEFEFEFETDERSRDPEPSTDAPPPKTKRENPDPPTESENVDSEPTSWSKLIIDPDI